MLVCKIFETVENFANSLGRLVTGLVREFLEFFDLEYSLAVFDPESNFVSIYMIQIDGLQLNNCNCVKISVVLRFGSRFGISTTPNTIFSHILQ